MSDTSSPFQPPPFASESGPDETSDEELEDEELEDEELEDEELEDEELEDEELDDEQDASLGSSPGNGTPGGAARAVLEHVARSIVDVPDAVVVDVSDGRSGVKLSLHVAPSDMGRIIGKRGRVAQAMRTLVRAAAAGDGTDASVDIVD